MVNETQTADRPQNGGTSAGDPERKATKMIETMLTSAMLDAYRTAACALDRLVYRPLDAHTCAVAGIEGEAPIRLSVPDYAPDGRLVTAVDDRAFSGCSSLRTVLLPDSVESVGVRAFAFCTSLLELRIGKNSRLASIGARAFMGCERLPVVRLGHLTHLTSVGVKAFAYCTGLCSVVLPDSLETLPEGLFEGCRRLGHVRLPGRLAVIGASAFSTCTSLCRVTLPESVVCIGEAAFACCDSLLHIALPVSPCMVAASAFMDCPAAPGECPIPGAV